MVYAENVGVVGGPGQAPTAFKLELFKNPIKYFINQEISAEMESSIAIVSSL
jgi:hypothetical protein